MTIWILAFLLLTILVLAGYALGAIRTAFSFVGIVVGALVAMPLGKLIKPLLAPLGVANPLLIWMLAPFIAFVLVQILFRIAGLAVHKKVEVFYKYKAGDLRLSLFERLNRRLGACLGLLNAAAYLILISLVIYPFSYLTVQMASGDQDSKLVRVLNQLGRDLVSTGIVKPVVAIDPVPASYYGVCDIVGLLYTDVRVHGRLGRYPLFMRLGEENQFQQIASDKSYTEMFVRRDPMGAVIGHPSTRAILDDPALVERLWNLTVPNLADLRAYLETGKSPKYDPEKILGRWSFDTHAAILALKRSNPNLTTAQMKLLRQFLYPILERAKFVAYPDNKAVLKGFVRFNFAVKPPTAAAPAAAPVQPSIRPGPGGRANRYGTPGTVAPAFSPGAMANPAAAAAAAASLVSDPKDLDGRWEGESGKYRLSFGDGMDFGAVIEGDRMTVAFITPLVFERD